MVSTRNKKRIILFLCLAFGISWLTALIIYLTGGLKDSPKYLIDNTQISLATILMASIYMFGPAIANILTRVITHEGKEAVYLRPQFDNGKWKYYLVAWISPGVCTMMGALIFFLIFPRYFDPNLTSLIHQLEAAGQTLNLGPWLIVAIQALQAILISPLLNTISAFGEEFGWRAYLQPKLMPLGTRKAVLITGVIWGIWHWPIILMGYNYGFDYIGAPFLGPLGMVWFTLNLGVILGWLSIKSENVWPAAIGHGAINGIASIGLLLVKGNPSTLLGPTPVGIIGAVGLTIFSLIILFHPNALQIQEIKHIA